MKACSACRAPRRLGWTRSAACCWSTCGQRCRWVKAWLLGNSRYQLLGGCMSGTNMCRNGGIARLDPFCHCFPLQDAGPALADTSPASTGTYVGCVWSEYQVLQVQLFQPGVGPCTRFLCWLAHAVHVHSEGCNQCCVPSLFTNLPLPSVQNNQRLQPSVASLTGSGLNFLVGRVSYTFGFQGELVQHTELGGCLAANTFTPSVEQCHVHAEGQTETAAPTLCRSLHWHGHRLLLFPGGRPPGPPRPAGRRDQRLGSVNEGPLHARRCTPGMQGQPGAGGMQHLPQQAP